MMTRQGAQQLVGRAVIEQWRTEQARRREHARMREAAGLGQARGTRGEDPREVTPRAIWSERHRPRLGAPPCVAAFGVEAEHG